MPKLEILVRNSNEVSRYVTAVTPTGHVLASTADLDLACDLTSDLIDRIRATYDQDQARVFREVLEQTGSAGLRDRTEIQKRLKPDGLFRRRG